MSDIIKVHDLPAIARYSSAVQEFSKSVDSASKQTMREFNEKAGKTGGSEDQGEAIKYFTEAGVSRVSYDYYSFFYGFINI